MSTRVDSKNCYETSAATGAGSNSTSNANSSESAQKSTPNSVVNPSGTTSGNSTDEVIINNTNTKLLERINLKLKENEDKYKELGFNDYKSMLLPSVGYSDKLEPEKQIIILESLSSILDYYMDEKNNNKIAAEGYNLKYDIMLTTVNLIQVLDNSNIKSFKEYKNLTKTNNTEFKKAKTDKQKFNAVKNEQIRIIKNIEKNRADELKKCTTQNAIDRVNKVYDDLVKVVKLQIQVNFTRENKLEDTRYFTMCRDAEDQAEAHSLAINLYEPEYQKRVADSFTHDFEIQLLEFFYNNGNPISAEEYGNIVNTIMQHKSEEGALQYEADAEEFRIKYENGEVDAPWLSKEYFDAEQSGIDSGSFSNPNIKAGQVEGNSYTSEATYNHNNNNKYNYTYNYVTTPISRENINEQTVQNKVDNNDLSLKTVLDFIDNKSAVQIIQNQKFTNYVKNASTKDLSIIAKSCSSEVYCYILRNISPEKAMELYEESKKFKCYSANLLGEKILEDKMKVNGNRNAVA